TSFLQLAEDQAAIEIERVSRRQDHAGRGKEGDPGIDAEGASKTQELANEARRSWQPDIGEREHHEAERVDRHAVGKTAERRDLARVHAVVNDADAEEKRG